MVRFSLITFLEVVMWYLFIGARDRKVIESSP